MSVKCCIFRRCQWLLLAVVGWLIWVVACDTLNSVHPARKPAPPPLAAPLLTEHPLYSRFTCDKLTLAIEPPPPPPSFLPEPRTRQVLNAHRLRRDVQIVLPARFHDARDQFEEEFAIRETSATPVKYKIASLKYQVDSVLFTLNNFSREMNGAMEWKPLKNTKKPPSTHISVLPLDETRVKVDVAFMKTRPYLGLTVAIPFGN